MQPQQPPAWPPQQPQQPIQGQPTVVSPQQQPPVPGNPLPPQGYGAAQPVQPQYDFILNPAPPSRKLSLNSSSLSQRILLIGGGLLVVLVILVVGKSLLTPKNEAVPAFTSVAQQQVELINLTTKAMAEPSLSASNNAFATTANVSLVSAEHTLLAYTSSNGFKISPKLLVARESKTLDAQLTQAASASTYNVVFDSTMKQQLATYKTLLQQAYTKVKGPNGKKLLNNAYNAEQLLEQQLAAAS